MEQEEKKIKTSYSKLLKIAIDQEAFIVLIQLAQTPNMLRLEYSKRKNGTLRLVEELSPTEEVITSCKLQGRSTECLAGGDWIKDIKGVLRSLKAQDWINNECFIDEYTK